MRGIHRSAVCLAIGFAITACDGSSAMDGGGADAAVMHHDAGAHDGGSMDAAPTDASTDAAVERDAGADAGLDGGQDAGVLGDAAIDAGSIDAGSSDAGGSTDARIEADAGTDAGSSSCVVPTSHSTIAAAVADPACARVTILAGTYAENVTIERSVDIVGDDGGVILDGSASGPVLRVETGAIVHLTQLTIQNGSVSFASGGGISNAGDLTLESCIVRDNAASQGAGIATTGPLLLRATRVESNTIDGGGDGAGILAIGTSVQVLEGSAVDTNEIRGIGDGHGGGIALQGADLVIEDSSVDGNTIQLSNTFGPSIGGGGISADASSTVSLGAGTTVSGNSVQADGTGATARPVLLGAGVYVNESTLEITGASITGNGALAGGVGLPAFIGGGGVGADASTVTIRDATIADNQLTSGRSGLGTAIGGGVYFAGQRTGPHLEIRRSTLSGNVTSAGLEQGGGLAVSYLMRDVELVLDQSTFSGNTANHGGGAYFYASGGNTMDVYVNGVTWTANVGGTSIGVEGAGGIEASNNVVVHVRSTILYGNSGSDADCSTGGGAEIDSVGYSVYGSVASCDFVGPATGDQIGADPVLGPLADNGGPTLTHMIGSGAAALDAADPAGCADHLGAAFTTDQRGFPRPIGRCDVGAVERSAP